MKAYLVTFSPMVRVIAEDNASEEDIVSIAVQIMRMNAEEYLHATHCEDVREDTECPYDPVKDKDLGF